MPEGSGSDPVITYKLENSRPVDLLDLTSSLAAFGEAYRDYVGCSGLELLPSNVRLVVRDIRAGSIIAELASLADQASWLLHHADLAGGFVSHFDQVLRYFLIPGSIGETPTKREAIQAISVMEPVAKDGGANLFLNVNGGDIQIHHHHYSYQEANAIQNQAKKFLGPPIPTEAVYQDQLLTLFQVRGVVTSTAGDRGIIESLSPDPVRLIFASDQVKAQILDQLENPFQKIFLVDVEAKSAAGRVRLYKILGVKDVLDRD
ncbi:MAG: hypothetical protein P4L68_05970 [Methylovirgula sp.]|nr:hypothetical protein [Methylovirgula sp.]